VAQEALDRAGNTSNKNANPNDPEKPFVTSGLRLGTAAVTTAGMGEAEMGEIAALIASVLRAPDDDGVRRETLDAANRLCAKYTPYPELEAR
jgi:glycine hydroxymethyltransferase